ncbi:uncharacterized protein EAE97_002281 [Botrytis byssoidea]|uniref:Uncharacterized protein n=1 Tax=Botrytis byssoidea TaxID=139641 RepID=A0A9P5IX20_9HELO|nr:uncharacterized protein EAE97_002281 [Botrytis byssoidea]KAF7950729.1 hypothetical protein EAE97_002281 [Botrytis byssoidea]
MPIIRNPFARKQDAGLQPSQDQTVSPRPSFERVSTQASRASSMSIKTAKSEEPPEYKMSVVNDSGVYLPPSPPEKKSFWPRSKSNLSATSINTRTTSNDAIDPFPISRESFDSYRRSFDISARSPISPIDGHAGRQSLDSARLPRMQRSAIGDRRFDRQPPTAEEGFEDVGLNDSANDPAKQVKKKGFFSKFGDEALPSFHMPGRKRGQSGTGEELGNIPKPNSTTPKVEIDEVR